MNKTNSKISYIKPNNNSNYFLSPLLRNKTEQSNLSTKTKLIKS